MNVVRPLVLAFVLCGAALAAPEPPPVPKSPRPKVVLRISRAFLVNLTRKDFQQDEPINTEASGATVNGTAHVAGGYNVKLHKSETESDFDLLVTAEITTGMQVTRKPVLVTLHGTAPFQASRRVVFDGKTFSARGVCVDACYHSNLDGICTMRHGPASALIRRVARPIVLKALPTADGEASQQIRTQVSTSVTQETDKIVNVLNEVATLHERAVELLRAKGVPIDRNRVAVAATDDYILAGVGFAPGQPPLLPTSADPAQAPVEIWVHRKLSPAQTLLVEVLREKLHEDWLRIKPKVKARIERHSPKLAELLDEVTDDVQLHALPDDPDWHVIRFSKQLHDATVKESAEGKGTR